jgi:lysophospholipase L1-like esterase
MNLLIFTCLFTFISTVFAAVSLTDNGNSFILKNDYATVTIEKKSGYITSLKYNGSNQEFLNRSYIDANGGKVYFSPNSNKVIKNTSSHVEVAFYDNYRSGSKLGLDWEVRYTMLSDTRGVYYSLTNTHKSSYPDTSYSEIRLVLRLKANVFNYLQVEDNVARVMPSAADQNKCVEKGPKEACQLPNGEVIHKYDYSVDMLKHHVHGFSSTTTGLGCWYIIPSLEWKNGGAYNRDLSCHQGGSDSLQIMYMNGSHYGGGDATIKKGEEFQKVYGPFLIYLNKANSVQASWNDAKNMANTEGKKWPYSFVSQPGYVKARGKVTGTLAINNPLTGTRLPLEDAVVTLVQPQSSTEPIPNQQWRHMSHWTHSLSGTTANFVIYAVIPGTYQLRAWSKNVVGEFVLDKLVTVKANEVTNLGKFTFNENRIAPIAWEIGIPDRTAMEYKHGDHFNQWGLYHKFKSEFPNGVNYYVGKSNYAKDWNYCQVSVPGNNGGKYVGVPWNIYFNLDKIPSGTSALRISIAASSYSALSVALNDGKASKEIIDLVDDACIRRDGIRGIYRELEFKYEPSAFKVGENKFTLYSRKTGGYQTYYSFDGIMYDHIRFESPGATASSSSNEQKVTVTKTTTAVIANATTRSNEIATNAATNNGSCNKLYWQCGGSNWKGSTNCCEGTCKKYNDFFSQCVPDGNNNNNKASNQAPPATTTQAPAPAAKSAAAPVKPGTIFIAGDSTADNDGAHNRKTNGWGKFLKDYVTCNVNNQGYSGQSARTFWRDGRWKTLISGVSKNDYVFIQFGHNDVGGPNNASEKGSAGGEGNEIVTVTRSNGQKEDVHTFPWYIRQMCKEVIAKGAKPVLLSYTPNFSFSNGKIGEGSRFQGYMKLVATEMKIPYIDLYSLIARKWEELGENYLKQNNWFPTDYKHTSAAGADFNAQMIITGIKCVEIQDLIAVLNNKGKSVNNQFKY